MVTTNITVRDTARITGHPIADFLALFSILISSPLIAGLSSHDYYNNCQKAIFSRERHFSIHILFFNLCNSALCIKFTAGLLLYSISCNFYKSYDAFKDTLYVISDSKVKGIPVRLHFTLIIVFFLIAWTLASSFMPRYFPNLTTVQYWIMGATGAIILFISVFLHELMH